MIKTSVTLNVGVLPLLKDRLQKNIYKKAMRAGSKAVVDDLRGTAPVVSGALKKSITNKVDSYRNGLLSYAVIGPRSKYTLKYKGELRKPSKYAHLVEAKHPFIAPAASKSQTYLTVLEKVVSDEVKKVVG